MSFHPAAKALVREVDESTKIFDQHANTEEATVVRAVLDGKHVAQPNRRSTTMYIVTSGSLQLTINDETYDMRAGDIAIAGVETLRSLQGNAAYVIASTPPFDPADEE